MKNRLARGNSLGAFAECFTGIQVSIESREVTRADFQPNAMTRQEEVTGCPQVDRKEIRLARFHHAGCARRLPIARTNNTVEKILRVTVRSYVDQFGGEVG